MNGSYYAIGSVDTSSTDSRLILKDEKLFNKTYGEWISKWWQWDINFPTNIHPSEFYLESRCGMNQTGPVWFLPDYVVSDKKPGHLVEERTCHIPSGKYVLAGINTGIYWTDSNESDAVIESGARAGQERANIYATINGTQLDIENNRQNTGIFNLSVPADNLYTNATHGKNYPAGLYRAFADGHFLFYGPLKPGNYVINWDFKAADEPFGKGPVESEGKVRYHLIVK